MKKLISTLVAAIFATSTLAAFAQAPAKSDAPKAAPPAAAPAADSTQISSATRGRSIVCDTITPKSPWERHFTLTD